MRPVMPTVEQVSALPELVRMTIPPEWQDYNGHVNVQYHFALYDRSGSPMLELVGVDNGGFSVDGVGFFDLESHVWYLNELHVGDIVSVHCRLLARTGKRFHGLVFIVNRARGLLASVFEFVSSGANLTTRRSARLPDPLAERMDQVIAEHDVLGWSPPTCGAMAP